MKLLFAKMTILSALLALAYATYHFSQEYPLGKSFQLGTLVALGVLAGAAVFFYILSILLMPLASRAEKSRQKTAPKEEVEEDEPFVIPKEERIIRHSSKEEYVKHRLTERTKHYEAQEKLSEMAGEQGTVMELMLILPTDLSYLLAKESIYNLFFGKIKEESEEAGIIVGSAGFGSSPQELRLTVQSVTGHSTKINIISKSPKKKQSDKKNSAYIKKISDFLREKEKFYTE